MKPINLSPTFLIKVYDRGYDYSVGEKMGLFPKKDTDAMRDGRLLHGLIAERLGGEKPKIAIFTFDSFRTKEAREWRDLQPDDTIIPCATELLVEKNINGYNVKGFIDLVSSDNESKTVIDWKFVSGQVFDAFGKKALHMHYDLQAAVYDFLVEPTNIYFGVIENESPHRIKLLHCDQSFLDSGATKFNKSFKILSEAKWREPNFNINEIEELMSWENL
jgi:hypothetical protein